MTGVRWLDRRGSAAAEYGRGEQDAGEPPVHPRTVSHSASRHGAGGEGCFESVPGDGWR